MARAGLQWTVNDLASQAGVVPNTVSNFEKGRDVSTRTVRCIQKALHETNRVMFKDDQSVSVLGD